MASSKLKKMAARGPKGITVGDFIDFVNMNNIPSDALVFANLSAGKRYPKGYSDLVTPWRLVFADDRGTQFDSFVAFDYDRP